MPDIIQLLPDNIANQIAAGEVIQRPASAVKELLENAVDAGASEIRLIIQDAGKSLIQVIDNGNGMTDNDARMAFERHATSKIKNIEDLFRIRTMGFRGEALASIAAVSQVELKTKKADAVTGTYLEIDNSVVRKQEPVAATDGTSIAMKNLFFSVPARRNFLKSHAAEMRHIVDEFIRVALSFPEIFFTVTSNAQKIFHLEKGTLKQRIVQILGEPLNAKLVSVQENTEYLKVYGFVGKPETARKTRGEQYFFVNNRFVRSAYLNHAVMGAYQQMIPADSFPLYVLFVDLDPSQLDINVHPTKQEIKFEDEKIIYAFLQAAVKHALAQFSITPALDFNLDPSIQRLDAVNKPFSQKKQMEAASSSLYRTFTQKNQAHFIEREEKNELKHWKEVYEPQHAKTEKQQLEDPGLTSLTDPLVPAMDGKLGTARGQVMQLHQTYILTVAPSGFVLIHQQLAHERILYERYQAAWQGQPVSMQKSLFPQTIHLSSQDGILLQDLVADLTELGYIVEPFGRDAFIIQGAPGDVLPGNEKNAIENLLEQFKHFSSDLKLSRREKLMRSMAWQHAIRPGTALTELEMITLVADLFKCAQPNISPNGKPTYAEFTNDYLEHLFRK